MDDLISKQELLKSIEHEYSHCVFFKQAQQAKGFQGAYQLTYDAPVISKQVECGYWIDKRTGAYNRMQSWCSACGKHSGIGGIKSNRHKPYCPNCGAKMYDPIEEQ